MVMVHPIYLRFPHHPIPNSLLATESIINSLRPIIQKYLNSEIIRLFKVEFDLIVDMNLAHLLQYFLCSLRLYN